MRKKSWGLQGLSTFTTAFRLYANTGQNREVNARRANATRSGDRTRCCANLDRGLTGAGHCHARWSPLRLLWRGIIPRWKNGERARIYVCTWRWVSERNNELALHNRLSRSLVSITVDGYTWRNTTTTGASRGNVRSCVQRSRPFANLTDLDLLGVETDVTIDGSAQTTRAKHRRWCPRKCAFLSLLVVLINQHVVENYTAGWFATSQHIYSICRLCSIRSRWLLFRYSRHLVNVCATPISLGIQLSMLQVKQHLGAFHLAL